MRSWVVFMLWALFAQYEPNLRVRGVEMTSTSESAHVVWGSPLEDHKMNTVCLPQDQHLARKDLSVFHFPGWLRTHRDPVGRCPVRYRQIIDRTRIWPPILIGAECSCQKSRCANRGPHLCHTAFVLRTIIKLNETGSNFIEIQQPVPIDCICAAQRAALLQFSTPSIVD